MSDSASVSITINSRGQITEVKSLRSNYTMVPSKQGKIMHTQSHKK